MPPFDLSRDALDTISLAGVAVGLLGLLLALAAHWRVRRLRRRVEAAAQRLPVPVPSGSAAPRDGLRHVAVVRFDAFPDITGRLSFAAALLDDAGNGLVLTSIQGRNESRTYAKAVHAGLSSQPLSPEEREAAEEALAGAAGVLVGSSGDGDDRESAG